MTIVYEEQLSDSPHVQTITHGYTLSSGATIRPAEINWHMVLVKHKDQTSALVVGPWATAGPVSWGEGAEIIWIRFRLGTFMPHLPTRRFLNTETTLPGATSRSFWLKGSAWEFPKHDNADTFINRLVRDEVLVHDPLVTDALGDHLKPLEVASRTLRHRFLRTTGLSQNHIRQVERAQRAAALLQQGVSILDTVHEAGYFDQPHLTRSLKQFIGYTPVQIMRMGQPDCHSVQDDSLQFGYNTNVLKQTV